MVISESSPPPMWVRVFGLVNLILIGTIAAVAVWG
jgi:hypothetical protein